MAAHAFSFASKLGALDVGDVIYVPDNAPLMGPTVAERAVHTAAYRSPRTKGRKFVTARCDVVYSRMLEHALRIERVS